MITFSTFLTVAIASFFVAIVPGPSVTVIIATALRSGTRAGLINCAGIQLGVLSMVLIVALGLETVVALMGEAFFWLKLAGAAYLVWLGIKLLRSDGSIGDADKLAPPSMGHFWHGFFVLWANPKALLFFGAFIPQFVDVSRDSFSQTILLGLIFMMITTVCDSTYAVLAGRAGSWLTRSKVRLAEIGSGLCLITGGLWLATSKQG